jgi:hypothetical protein
MESSQIEHGNPVLPSRFHADIFTVVLKQPVLEAEDITVECGKAFLLIIGLYAFGNYDCHDA